MGFQMARAIHRLVDFLFLRLPWNIDQSTLLVAVTEPVVLIEVNSRSYNLVGTPRFIVTQSIYEVHLIRCL